MIGASGALFLINLIIKKYSNDEIYSYFALFIIFSGYATSLSLLASEQVALRYTEIKENKTNIEKEILNIILLSSIAAAVIFFFLTNFLFNEIDGFVIMLCLVTFASSSLTTIAYNYHRLKSNFNKAQILLNLWKYLLPACFLTVYFFDITLNRETISSVLSICLLVSAVTSTYTLYINRDNIIVGNLKKTSYKKLFMSQIGFLTSLSFLSMANTFDKIYIEHFLSKKEFSDYFFTALVLMYPTLALSNYVGFKEFTKIKNGAYYALDRIIIRLTLMGCAIFVLNTSIIYALREHIPILWNPGIITLLLIFSAARLPYSFLSAVMGAKATASQLFNSNVLCWCIALIGIGVFLLITKSLFNALFCTLCIWIMRDIVYYWYAKKTFSLASTK